MGKSVYSLVLSDDIIEAVDEAAYRERTSRSALINRILAEHLSLATPEGIRVEILEELTRLIREPFLLEKRNADSLLCIRSPLKYKYKPTIRYSVELFRDPGENFGRLRVSFRTQNPALLEMIYDFFNRFVILEARMLSRRIAYEVAPGRLSRPLRLPEGIDGPELGPAIAGYIRMLDGLIKLYFPEADRPDRIDALLAQGYTRYLQHATLRL